MPDNVKTALSIALGRLLRPLVKIMLREGFTYPHFAAIARMAFVESAAKDFVEKGTKSPISSVCALTGMSAEEVQSALLEHERFETDGLLDLSDFCARVLHGWHNDRDYVGPYGLPADLPFAGHAQSFTALTGRHAPGVAPEVILQELQRVQAVAEVGANIWKPLQRQYIEASLSPGNLARMAILMTSLLSTLENNTRSGRDGTEFFERTVSVDSPLTSAQLVALQSHLKVVGGQFLQRLDSFAAVDLRKDVDTQPGEVADIRAGLQCFLYVEPTPDETRLRDAIKFD
jgi:Family of unknown function (DUF6502)